MSVPDVTLDTPNLSSAHLQLSDLTILSCSLTFLYVSLLGNFIRFGVLNVDWYKIKRLFTDGDQTYWQLINKYVPSDAKIANVDASLTKFRVTDVRLNFLALNAANEFLRNMICYLGSPP